jgi:uncharacterized protein (DUF342 family)
MNNKSFANQIERKRFGNQQKAWMVVEIAHDARKAYLRELCLGGDASLGLSDILTVLGDHYHIVCGIDEEVIQKVLTEVVLEPSRKFISRKDVAIASDVLPVAAHDGRIDYVCLDSRGGQVRLPYEAMVVAFEQKTIAAVLAQHIRVCPVVPGEKLAVLSPAQLGQPGRDIWGRITTPVTAPAPKSAILKAGAFVREEQRHFYSEIYGYLCVLNDEISVLPPIWISADGFEAHFIHFPHVGSRVLPHHEWVLQLCQLKGLSQSVSEEQVQKLQDYMVDRGAHKGSFLLMQGAIPVPGADAYLKCLFDSKIKPNMILSDGRFDVEARRRATRVNSGQLIAEMVPPTPGIPGANLKGDILPAQDGKFCPVKVGDNVHVGYEGDHPRFFYAKFDGNVHVHPPQVQVHLVLRIGGDADEKTGHIQTDQDVEIVGSVRAGIKIQAGGSVTIGGGIEQGVFVTAKGDVMVGEGIVGSETKVVALGDVAAKYIEKCSVVARGNVMVSDRIEKGFVRAGGKVLVQSSFGSGGRIAGGVVYAAEGVGAREIGTSDGGGDTLVGIHLDMEIEARIKKLSDTCAFCQNNILRIFRTLNIQSIDPVMLKNILEKTPPGKKRLIADLLLKLRELVVHQDKAEKQKKVLMDQGARILEKAEIKADHKIHAGVQIRIGNYTHALKESLNHPVFFATMTGINWRTE